MVTQTARFVPSPAAATAAALWKVGAQLFSISPCDLSGKKGSKCGDFFYYYLLHRQGLSIEEEGMCVCVCITLTIPASTLFFWGRFTYTPVLLSYTLFPSILCVAVVAVVSCKVNLTGVCALKYPESKFNIF